MLLETGVILLLLLLNGFFAMSELAIVSAKRGLLRQMAEDRVCGAQEALDLLEDPTTFLSIIQIGVTLGSILAGTFTGATLAGRLAAFFNDIPFLADYSSELAMVLSVVGVTYLTLVIGELVPKRLGLARAETIAVRVAPFMLFLVRAAKPLVWLLKASTELTVKMVGFGEHQAAQVTEAEVKDMIAEGAESGVFMPAEKNMLEAVMRLADRTVRAIMTPRIDLVWLGIEDSPEDWIKIMRGSGYSHFPVGRGDLQEVLGIVHAKDLLNQQIAGKPLDLKSVMRPPFRVPDNMSVLRLLDEFKRSSHHHAIVIDEYGSVEGLVSANDILVSITGLIPDPSQDQGSKPFRRADGSWLIDGMCPIDEVEALLGLKNLRDGDDFHTLAGFIMNKIGRVPSAGDHFFWNETRFEVIDMDARRVDKVLIIPPPEEQQNV